jgi:hypothetical protein
MRPDAMILRPLPRMAELDKTVDAIRGRYIFAQRRVGCMCGWRC